MDFASTDSTAFDQDWLNLWMWNLRILRADCTWNLFGRQIFLKSAALREPWCCKDMTKRIQNGEMFWCSLVLMLHAQSCSTLCDPMDCSLSGSSVHGISQARILEWVAISYSGGSSRSRDRNCVSCSFCIGRQVLHHCATWKAHVLVLLTGIVLLWNFKVI